MRLASYRSSKTVVGQSSIVGRGLFANATIARGEIVCVKAGYLLSKADLMMHENAVQDADLQITDDLFLAPISEIEFEGVMMFLNHSCEPNVGIRGQIVFVAMREITAGEELTLDYATIDHDTEAMTCKCGSTHCRQVVTGDDWQKPELQQKYGEFFAWFLMEKIRENRS